MVEYLKRTEGKKNGNVKRKELFRFYKQNRKSKQVTEKQYTAFLSEFLDTLMINVVTENLEVKIPFVGTIRIKSIPKKILTKTGEFGKLYPDWKKTWEFWHSKYPDLSRDEIIKIENKKLIYHENDHSNGEVYKFYWSRYNIKFAYSYLYEFTASRAYMRLLAKTVKDPNRSVFYYG